MGQSKDLVTVAYSRSSMCEYCSLQIGALRTRKAIYTNVWPIMPFPADVVHCSTVVLLNAFSRQPSEGDIAQASIATCNRRLAANVTGRRAQIAVFASCNTILPGVATCIG